MIHVPAYNRLDLAKSTAMTLNLQLSPDVEAKLRDLAAQIGSSPETLALEALVDKLSVAADLGDFLPPSTRLAEFDDWFTSHPVSKAAVLDDSRESIYNGRGE